MNPVEELYQFMCWELLFRRRVISDYASISSLGWTMHNYSLSRYIRFTESIIIVDLFSFPSSSGTFRIQRSLKSFHPFGIAGVMGLVGTSVLRSPALSALFWCLGRFPPFHKNRCPYSWWTQHRIVVYKR